MIAIINYNAGNISSVKNAVERLGFECLVTDKPEEIRSAEKLIFPGVGEAASAMKVLQEKGLDQVIRSLKQPVLGICLGMQLMCRYSEEGSAFGLGIFNTDVRKFPATGIVPQMGWNSIRPVQGKTNALFGNFSNKDDLYFVHSYYAEICEDTSMLCDYLLTFSAVLQKDNFFGVQFHPEKSGKVGEAVLGKFLSNY